MPKIEAEPDYVGHTSAPYKLHAGGVDRAGRLDPAKRYCGVATGGRAIALVLTTRLG